MPDEPCDRPALPAAAGGAPRHQRLAPWHRLFPVRPGLCLGWLRGRDRLPARPADTLLLLFATALFSLLLNIKYLTGTTALELRYLHPAHFRRYCREAGETGVLATLTVSGLYTLIACAWVLAIYKFVRVHL